MNTKAQSGPIGFVVLVIVFVILWFMWIGGWLVEVGQTAIAENSLIGFNAFVYANLNLVVFLGLMLGIMGYMYFAIK